MFIALISAHATHALMWFRTRVEPILAQATLELAGIPLPITLHSAPISLQASPEWL